MKKKKDIELDVDFIGEQKPLSKEEELKISNFIKLSRPKKTIRRKRKVKVTI